MAAKSVGRPRSFDEDVALRHATELFWEKGYAATSLDDLLAAMGIARSSFYSTFGSKQKVLWRALELYTCELLARMRDAAAAESTPRATWRCAASASTTSTRWTACSRPCSSHSASMRGAHRTPAGP